LTELSSGQSNEEVYVDLFVALYLSSIYTRRRSSWSGCASYCLCHRFTCRVLHSGQRPFNFL